MSEHPFYQSLRQSLAVRFCLYIVTALVLANMAGLFIVYRVQEGKHRQELLEHGESMGQYMATAIAPLLFRHDNPGLDLLGSKAVQQADVFYVAVTAPNETYVSANIDQNHPHFSENLEDDHGEALDNDNPLAVVKHLRTASHCRQHLDISTPILYGGKILGQLVLGLSTDLSTKKNRQLLLVLLLSNGLIAVLLALVIIAVFWRHILQPLHHLAEGMQQVGAGDLDMAVPVARNDELGRLSLCFNRMVNARREAEDITQKARQEWERLFNAVEDVVTIQGQDMRISQANAATGRLLNVDPAELIGRYCYEVFAGHMEMCDGCPAEACQKDLLYHVAEISHSALDRTFNVSTFPIIDPEDGFVGIAHIARDITEQKKLEFQFRQAQKMEAIGTLAGGIAHDFNNLLTPIFGYAQLIEMKAGENSELSGDIGQILKSATLAKELVQQILSFSREHPHKLQRLQPVSVVKESLKLLRASIPASIEFKEEIHSICGSIMADPAQLHQVVMNLCTNSYQAMQEDGGVLGVALKQVVLSPKEASLTGNLPPGNYICLQISDTGCGMDEKIQEKIFEPFFTTKEEGQGTGLGLAVVYGIIKEYGGTLRVYSEQGEGTTMNVYLPLVEGEEGTGTASTPGTKDVKGGTEHIMVVDDKEDIVNFTSSMLTRLGYRVSGFCDSRQALQAFQEAPDEFALVITDMTMPGMDGLQFTEELVAIRPDVAVVLCTGHAEMAVAAVNKQDIRVAYTAKPIDVTQLSQTIRRLLEE